MRTPTPHLALLLILLTILFTVIGQVLVKQGSVEVGHSPSQLREVPAFLGRAFTNWHVLLGLAAAGVAAGAWVAALSRSKLSFAYPFMGLAIVLVLAISGRMLGEEVPLTRWLGVGIVCIGILVAAR